MQNFQQAHNSSNCLSFRVSTFFKIDVLVHINLLSDGKTKCVGQ